MTPLRGGVQVEKRTVYIYGGEEFSSVLPLKLRMLSDLIEKGVPDGANLPQWVDRHGTSALAHHLLNHQADLRAVLEWSPPPADGGGR